MPKENNDKAIQALEAVNTALWALPEEDDRKRVLRAAAILLGFDFIEDARRRR